ncbi:hypothetical protein BX286_0073 [Streptomyces sp. 3211.6]|uniref:hypothetical protein n=1 Tax=Streptomyces sp. 3211.6 TaxID=1938845 RepID=UPI000C2C39D1|nr:hypothetical protein [Streptomyces sp. 3211.6]RKT02204.1 hypothetical protein BX286_0073 [Streptomyces sp. 3211.6]
MTIIGNDRQIKSARRQDAALPEVLGTRSVDTGKVVRSGVATNIFWHFEDFSFHGEFFHTIRLPTAQVNAFSQIAVSICERDADGNPSIGDAKMEVHNVVPFGDGRIAVRGDIHWGTNLPVRLNYIIVT